MKGFITIEFSAKEAMSLLTNDTVATSVTKKIVSAFRLSNTVRPLGAKAAVVARKPKKTKTTDENTHIN